MGSRRASLRLDAVSGESIKISVLTNAVYYFMQYVFIVAQGGKYRLYVIHNKKLLVDETYKSAKGAKIAFLKMYWYKAWHDGVKPKWTHFYGPDDDWMGKYLSLQRSQGQSKVTSQAPTAWQ
ncbi:MAG: hypothetical protein GY765_27605 [bacterium]|nr:hypothetical protein [bacterium]